MEIDKENVVQAVVVMDTFNNNFAPIVNDKPMAFLSVGGVPLIDYILDSLALGGVGETVLFCCQDGVKIKDYVKNCQKEKALWSLTMDVQVKMSDTCQTMGDVMREIDAAGLIRGPFILTGINSITNINFASLLEQHKQTCKKDKGAAMTLVYKQVSWEHPLIRSDKPIFLAADGRTNKVLVHKKYKPRSTEKTVDLPLEVVLNHSEVKLHHNLVDPIIALCSPSVPPLFSDNFDFQTRDDFIHGILINEEILASSLYYTILKGNQYAAAVTNWKTYQTISRDILHNWTFPLTFETGSFSKNNYILLGSHSFVANTATLSRSCKFPEDVIVGANCQIKDDTTITKSMIGKNCTIGNNVKMQGSYVMDNVVVKDNCIVTNSFIDENSVVEENCALEGGTIVAANVRVEAGSVLKGSILDDTTGDKDKNLQKSVSETTEWENESSGYGDDEVIGFDKTWSDSESCYSSDSSAESSMAASPIPEDTNTTSVEQYLIHIHDMEDVWKCIFRVFLQEVIDSLARGYEDKLKCDYLILEINSSRYAYNIQLHEVNFFVVRALLSIPVLAESKNVLVTAKDILKFFRPILSNYIKTKPSIKDCLRAVEDSCIQCEWLNDKCGHIIHMLYETDVIDEDSLMEWREDLEENESPVLKQASLIKFFDWLQDASEESESE